MKNKENNTMPMWCMGKKVTEANIDELVELLGIKDKYSVDFDSPEVVTILWNEEDRLNGPCIILLEGEELIVASGDISEEDEERFKVIYSDFLG